MIISSRENIETTIKSCHLFVKEVKLYENDLFFWISSLRTQSKNYINIWN